MNKIFKVIQKIYQQTAEVIENFKKNPKGTAQLILDRVESKVSKYLHFFKFFFS